MIFRDSWVLALGSWVLGANVERKLLGALAFEVLLHLVQRGTTRRPRRVECPCAFRAHPTLAVHGSDPNHFPHGRPLDVELPSRFRGPATAGRSSPGTTDSNFSRILASAAACWRTAWTTSIGTCSKCVCLFRIAAAPLAARTVTICKLYGENLQ